MIQEMQEIMNMLAVELMPEIMDFVENVPLGDEVSNLIRLIRCVRMVHRLLVTGKRLASRIQAKKRSEQGRDVDE